MRQLRTFLATFVTRDRGRDFEGSEEAHEQTIGELRDCDTADLFKPYAASASQAKNRFNACVMLARAASSRRDQIGRHR